MATTGKSLFLWGSVGTIGVAVTVITPVVISLKLKNPAPIGHYYTDHIRYDINNDGKLDEKDPIMLFQSPPEMYSYLSNVEKNGNNIGHWHQSNDYWVVKDSPSTYSEYNFLAEPSDQTNNAKNALVKKVVASSDFINPPTKAINLSSNFATGPKPGVAVDITQADIDNNSSAYGIVYKKADGSATQDESAAKKSYIVNDAEELAYSTGISQAGAVKNRPDYNSMFSADNLSFNFSSLFSGIQGVDSGAKIESFSTRQAAIEKAIDVMFRVFGPQIAPISNPFDSATNEWTVYWTVNWNTWKYYDFDRVRPYPTYQIKVPGQATDKPEDVLKAALSEWKSPNSEIYKAAEVNLPIIVGNKTTFKVNDGKPDYTTGSFFAPNDDSLKLISNIRGQDGQTIVSSQQIVDKFQGLKGETNSQKLYLNSSIQTNIEQKFISLNQLMQNGWKDFDKLMPSDGRTAWIIDTSDENYSYHGNDEKAFLNKGFYSEDEALNAYFQTIVDKLPSYRSSDLKEFAHKTLIGDEMLKQFISSPENLINTYPCISLATEKESDLTGYYFYDPAKDPISSKNPSFAMPL